MESAGEDIKQLLRVINDEPDKLHGDFTPAVLKLMTKGLPAARAVLPLLNSQDFASRARAYRVLEGVIKIRNGWVPGQGYKDREGQDKTQATLAANGNYNAQMEEPQRLAAIEKWRSWLESSRE
jgi:hypothetical protein